MQLRYRYRLYPLPGQRLALARAFGCARVVFNDALRTRQEAYAAGLPYVTDGELSAQLTAAKRTAERVWLNEVSAVVLQQALADLNAAYRNFFTSLTSTHKGPRMGAPRFRSARTIGRRFGSRLMLGSRSPRVGSCSCRRLGMSLCAGPGRCLPARLR
jgi:putative transposase